MHTYMFHDMHTFLQLPVAAHSQRSHPTVLVNRVALACPRQCIVYREEWGIVCEKEREREQDNGHNY